MLEELDDTLCRIFIRGCGLSSIVDDCSTVARTCRQPSKVQLTIDEAVKLPRRRVHAILHLVAVGVHERHGDVFLGRREIQHGRDALVHLIIDANSVIDQTITSCQRSHIYVCLTLHIFYHIAICGCLTSI